MCRSFPIQLAKQSANKATRLLREGPKVAHLPVRPIHIWNNTTNPFPIVKIKENGQQKEVLLIGEESICSKRLSNILNWGAITVLKSPPFAVCVNPSLTSFTPPKHISLDWDNTLVNSGPTMFNLSVLLSKQYGLAPPTNMYHYARLLTFLGHQLATAFEKNQPPSPRSLKAFTRAIDTQLLELTRHEAIPLFPSTKITLEILNKEGCRLMLNSSNTQAIKCAQFFGLDHRFHLLKAGQSKSQSILDFFRYKNSNEALIHCDDEMRGIKATNEAKKGIGENQKVYSVMAFSNQKPHHFFVPDKDDTTLFEGQFYGPLSALLFPQCYDIESNRYVSGVKIENFQSDFFIGKPLGALSLFRGSFLSCSVFLNRAHSAINENPQFTLKEKKAADLCFQHFQTIFNQSH